MTTTTRATTKAAAATAAGGGGEEGTGGSGTTGTTTGGSGRPKVSERGTGNRKPSDAPGASASGKKPAAKPAPKPAPRVPGTGGDTRGGMRRGEEGAGVGTPEERARGSATAPDDSAGVGAGAPRGSAYGTGVGAGAPGGSAEGGAAAPEAGAGAPGGGGDGGGAPGGGAGAPGGGGAGAPGEGAGAPGGGGGAPGGGGGAPGGGGGGGGGPAGPPPPLSAVGMALTVCGANPFEIYALEFTKRLNTMESYGRMTADDVTQLASRLEKRPYPYTVSLPTSVVKNIQGLCFWSARARRQGRIIRNGDFDQYELSEALDGMEIQAEKSVAPDIKPPQRRELGGMVPRISDIPVPHPR